MSTAENAYGFIGLGLIGGSIARAIRQNDPEAYILAYNPSRNSLDEALADGVLSEAADGIDDTFKKCHYIFLCAPVGSNTDNLPAVKAHMSDDAIITDIGSVKTGIHNAVVGLGLSSHFIGGHPMTGSERTKYRNSKASLLENAYYILAPEKEVPKKEVEAFRKLVESFHSMPLILDNDLHDYVTGAVSHVPHVVSATLVNLVRESDTDDGVMKMIAAGGFKDITRISSSSPTMWQHICLTNKDNIVKLLDRYIADLQANRDKIASADKDAIYELFDSARKYRDSFSDVHSGPIMQEFVLHIDIADHPGAIAEVADLLAKEDINIKNIGITHNREFAYGAMRLELNTAKRRDETREVLKAHGFHVVD